MIDTPVTAAPGLIPFFAVIAVLLALPTAWVARVRGRPGGPPVMLAVALAGVLAVALLPGSVGTGMHGLCDTGAPARLLTSPSALLNIALFVPVSALGVRVFRRPLTVIAVAVVGSGTVEIVQANGPLGRACSVTDLAANAVGALAGAAAGVLWLRLRGAGVDRAVRDLCWSAGLALTGAGLLFGWSAASVSTVDAVAAREEREAVVRAPDGAEAWLASAAEEVFGEGTRTTGTTADRGGGRTRITARTDRGELVAWWPERILVRAWSTGYRAEDGSPGDARVRERGAGFAARWFPESVAGSRASVERVGGAGGGIHVLTYRRYIGGVMMPMRLDITLTAGGRILGFDSKPLPDPVLPRAVVGRAEAERIAEAATGTEAAGAVLLAQRLPGGWRPVWMMGGGPEAPELFIDAVTGRRVTPGRL
ncbi:VanZ family protein [Streptomyces sp. CAU 1734]|uniref:VanZ family protein n=1 Tax=Streptomyces sp. CAU 1734 TaxID=3140360 RepID=UPI0032605A8F